MNINLSLKLILLTLVLIPALTYGQWTTSGTNIYTTNAGNVGIGTTTPFGKLDVNGAIFLPGSIVNTMTRPVIAATRISGEIAGYSKTGLGADDGFLRLSAGGGSNSFTKTFIDLSGYSTIPDMERNITFGTSGVERIRITNSGDVAIGTIDPKGYKLAVAGNMIAESVKVKLQGTWPDYVFSKSYQLPSLEETEKHIQEKGHLPGIPSAEDVKSNGVNLGEMNAKLLQKVEELTLYIIDQNQKMKEVVERLENLESKKLE